MKLIEPRKLDEHPLLHALGTEPLSNAMTPEMLAKRGKGRKQPLKALLLDQRVLAGIGNIYACEALHRARLMPDRPASVLALPSGAASAAAKRLAPAIREVLQEAIEAGGSSLRDYRKADGVAGLFPAPFPGLWPRRQALQKPGLK